MIVECLEKYLKDEDVQRFNDLWDLRFPEQLKNEVCLLFKKIISNDKDEVNRIKNKLLTEYKSECEPWLQNINL